MPFRSGKSFFRRFAEAGCAFALSFSALPALGATITVSLSPPYGGLVGTDAYFASENDSGADPGDDPSTAFIDSGFNVFEMDQTSGDSDRINFTVRLNEAVSLQSGKRLILVINTPTNSGVKQIPISYVDGVACSSTYCQDQSADGQPFYAAIIPNPGTITVGFYPRLACTRYKGYSSGTYPTGCTELISGSSSYGGSSTTTGSIELRFEIYQADSVVTGGIGSATAEASSVIDAHFYTTAPTMSCDATSGIYTPSDGAIYVNMGKFGLRNSDTENGAPAAKALVTVKEDPTQTTTADVTSSFRSSSQAVTELTYGGEALVGGFANSTQSASYFYDVGFLVRDAAGVVVTNSCKLNDAQTADIQGFLQEGKCFIASAAFRSTKATPVLLLRQFRDEVLLQNAAGRAFVKQYYAWSPAAAQWLIRNPAFRGPILIALVPVQVIAWLALHPAILLTLGALGMGLVLFALGCSRRLQKAWVASLLLVGMFAQAESVQPYIDRLKQKLPDSATSESYTERIKENLKPSSAGSPEGYTEWLKKHGSLTGSPSAPSSEGYTDREKARLGASETAGGAIAAVQEGRSELEMKRGTSPKNSLGLRYGFGLNRQITSSESIRSFGDVYGSNYAPDISLFYEYQFVRNESWGSLGLFSQLGVSFFKGRGQFAIALPDVAGSGSFGVDSARTTFRFFMVPVVVGPSVRINAAHFIRPYAMVGGAAIYFAETRDDGGTGANGIARAFYGAGGVAVMLDELSRSAAWRMYDDYGFKHFYFNIEYAKYFPLGGRVDFDVSGVFAGLTFDI